ncbi:MAG TPA: SRPBCC family protein [Phycisphaerales bacterium]|nr:SRPBCC family protein [Phycisphaerales bacterium]
MAVVESSTTIACTPEDAFDLSQDYALRLEWDPFLADLKFLDGARVAAVGVKTWVRSKRGLEMTSEYVAFDRPRVVAIKMVDGPWFFRQFGGSWRFREADGSTAESPATEVTMRYTFDLVPALRWIEFVAAPVVRRVFLRDVRARLAGLKRGIEQRRRGFGGRGALGSGSE